MEVLADGIAPELLFPTLGGFVVPAGVGLGLEVVCSCSTSLFNRSPIGVIVGRIHRTVGSCSSISIGIQFCSCIGSVGSIGR